MDHSIIQKCEREPPIMTSLTSYKSLACGDMKSELPKTDVISNESLEISDQDSNTISESEAESTSVTSLIDDDVVQQTFERSKSRWIEDPVISRWRNPNHRIHEVLSEVNDLYRDWGAIEPGPFALSPDPLWTDTGRAIASAGLPWHNNQVNLPNEIDTSWPFHFKEFESQLLQAKGSRVGDPDPSGYVTSYDEANLYCIRALQQELREQFPTERPILVYDQFNSELIASAEKLFGLEVHRASLSGPMESLKQELLSATLSATKPIILAVTLYNSSAEHDNLSAVSQLARMFPLILHVDAFRSFDRITCFSGSSDKQCGGKLRLGVRDFKQPSPEDDQSILASTIVAGSLDYSRRDGAIALKPASLGEKPTRVAYIRAFDSTLSGSRDAIPPLWLALYERRLGDGGLRHACQYLESLRSHVLRMLEYHNISAIASPYSTDIIVRSCTRFQKGKLLGLGGSIATKGNIILSINPYFSAIRLYSLLHAQLPFGSENRINEQAPHYQDFVSLYPIPSGILNEIRVKVQSWQIATRSIAGYPLHMGSLAALGPVIGLFWDLNIPKEWIERESSKILSSRMKAFGLASPESRKKFKGIFTNGSTMGNRCGIMTALEHFPHAFIYFSAETHYSVIKTLRDCDTLREGSRYSQIRCSHDGSILVEALVQKAISDRKRCIESGIEYQMILFANMGTTFAGAKDDLVSIYQKLSNAEIQISYIHADGALEFGFETCGIELGPCGALSNDGKPLVQGVTVSHHKALGHTVSGEVLCFSPGNQLPSSLSSLVPQVVFEIWLYSRVYEPTEKSLMLNTCRENASHLETGLRGIRVATKRNDNGIITVLERPPAWVIEEFSLRPEGNWVHFITMPSVSRETVDRFVDQLWYIENQFSFAFSHTVPLLSDALERGIKLQRVQCCSALSERVLKLTQSLVTLNGACGSDVDLAVNAKPRLRGAVSVVAVDEQDEIQVVFLAGSNRDQSIHVGPLLIRNEFVRNQKGIVDISKLLMGLLGKYLKARINVDSSSYQVYNIVSAESCCWLEAF